MLFVLNNVGKKKNSKHLFHYLSRREFKKIKKENDEVSIIGATSLKERKEDDTKNTKDSFLQIGKKYFEVKEKSRKYVKGYIDVGNNQYIEYCGSLFPFILLFLLIAITAILLFKGIKDGELPDFPIAIGEESKNPSEEGESDSIIISGYSDMVVSETRKYVELQNDKANDVYLKYEIYVNGEKIHETDAIEPGKMVNWDAYTTLKNPGTYEVKMSVLAYTMETHERLNSAVQTVNITVQ